MIMFVPFLSYLERSIFNFIYLQLLLISDYELLTKMIEDEVNFLEVKALGEDLAWRVIKLWMQSAGRDLNNYQVQISSTFYVQLLRS